MSASNAAAEPSMEEILSSIRQAINEDIPGAVPETSGDPFASGSSAEAAFAAPPPGQEFDATVHSSHDPFAELTRKLNETRESVQKQMHGVSSNLRSEQPEEEQAVQPAAPAEPAAQEIPTPPPPAPEAPPVVKGGPDPFRAAVFSSESEQAAPEEKPSAPQASSALQALTTRVEEQKPADAASSVAERIKESRAEAPADTAPVSGGASGPQVPELSWASAERAAPAPVREEKPDPAPAAEKAPPAMPSMKTAEPAEAELAPKAEADPLSKLTAVAETQAAVSAGGAKTDQAMVDLVLRRILEPAVKSWLDDNLPRIVTEVVREEVRRVANQPN